MSYTLRGRLESRAIASLAPVILALVLTLAVDQRWPLDLAGLMIGTGLLLDVVLYHRLLPYQPGWLALPLGLLELSFVMALAYVLGVGAPIWAALGFYAGSWVVAQVLAHAVFPLVCLSYAEDGGEFGPHGKLLTTSLLIVFGLGLGFAPGTELTGPLACGGGFARTFATGNRDGLACLNVAELVGLQFDGAYGSTTDVGMTDDSLRMSRAMQREMGNGAAVGDYDGDGDLDVYLLAQGGHSNRLFRNDLDRSTGQKHFTDVTESASVGGKGMSRVAHFADLDGDSLLDLVVVNDYVPEEGMSPSRIYRNRGDGTFEDVSAGSGFDPVGYIVGGASLVDYDQDGLLDIYVTYWIMSVPTFSFGGVGTDSMPGRNHLYRNLGNFRFQDVTDETGLANQSNSFTSTFADFDRDGDQDLFLARDTGGPDIYYENLRGKFEEVSTEVGASHRGSDMGVALGDVEGNGTLDLYVTNITDPTGEFGYSKGNALLTDQSIGNEVSFTDRAYELGIEDTGWGWGTVFTDIDLDGDLDLYSVQGMDAVVSRDSARLRDARARLFLNDGQGRFEVPDWTPFNVEGDQRALIAFDYDRDGDPDYLITQVDRGVQLLENRSSVGHFLTVVPEPSRRFTIEGSEVSVVVGGRITTQVVLAGGSYLAGPPPELYFGLGSATYADEVRVRWPDGTHTLLRNVVGDQILKVSP